MTPNLNHPFAFETENFLYLDLANKKLSRRAFFIVNNEYPERNSQLGLQKGHLLEMHLLCGHWCLMGRDI